MPRLRIEPARKHQHKKRAYRDAQSAHFVPRSSNAGDYRASSDSYTNRAPGNLPTAFIR